MIAELNDSPKIYVKLYLDGMLVTLYGTQDLITDVFLQTFSIEYME
jgi:hypothetical protein